VDFGAPPPDSPPRRRTAGAEKNRESAEVFKLAPSSSKPTDDSASEEGKDVDRDKRTSATPRAKRRRRRVQFDDDVARPDPRQCIQWERVRRGLLLVLIAIGAGLLMRVAGFLPGVFDSFGFRIIMLCVQALPLAGYVFCTFVPLSGWPKRLSIINLGLFVGLFCMQAIGEVERVQAEGTLRELEAKQEAKQELIRKARNNPEALQKLRDENTAELAELGNAKKEPFWRPLWDALSMLGFKFLAFLSIPVFAFFLQRIALHFKAESQARDCLLLLLGALFFIVLEILGFVVIASGASFAVYLIWLFMPLELILLLVEIRVLLMMRSLIADQLP
jgi:hypothetical protein